MGRNLYILGATLGLLALISIGLSFSHVGEVPGVPSDDSLWRTTGVALLAISLVVGLAGVLSSLFEQAERRAENQRRDVREGRRTRQTARPSLGEERRERQRRSGDVGGL